MMTPERWQQVKGVLEGALELGPDERHAFLDRACSTDHSLRREVESLLSSDNDVRSSFLKSSPCNADLRLSEGTKLGDFEILSLLGSGGMGEVYRARDHRLERDVALKVLPRFVSLDPERLHRFEQEARAAAALNHPNILAVFQMGNNEGAPYLVSELLEGETLREQLKPGPIPLRKAADYGVQIAHGLAAAHEKGIVHRDLKPENLFVTRDGRIKILDFGLAKLTHSERETQVEKQMLNTEPGVVLGTVGYTSPEQVRGQTADYRSDIFAFGAILYEMLSGRRAFQKTTAADAMSAILNEDPPAISSIALGIPHALERVVIRCLEKSAGQRFQSAWDLAFALEALTDSGSSVTVAVADKTGPTRGRKIALAVTLTLLVLGLAALVWLTRRDQPIKVGQYARLTNDGRDKSGSLSNGIPSPIVTDGTRLYFVESMTGLFGLAQVSLIGGDIVPVSSPFRNVRLTDISPDRTHLLIGNTEGPTLVEEPFYSLPAIGGSAQRLGDFRAHDASWSPNGLSLAFAVADTLNIAKPDGSASKKLVGGLGAVWWPRWSPNGTHLRFTVTQTRTQQNSIWEIAADGTHLREVSHDWNLPGDQCCGSWMPDGRHFVFQSSQWNGSTLWVVSENNLPLRRPHPVQLPAGPIWGSAPTVNTDGKKLFFIGSQPRTEVVRYDPKRKRFMSFLTGISADALDFTKDGRWITYTQYPEGSLWRARADGTERVQLTSGALYAFRPRWSPDGTRIVFFGTYPHHPWKLYLLPASGGTPTQLIPDEANEGDPTWSPDGTRVAFGRLPWMASAAEKPLLYIVNVSSKEVAMLPGSEGLFSPRWSPLGRYLAALSADSTKLMLYDFQVNEWRQLAQGSYGNPEWSRDGAFLYAIAAETMTVVRIRISDGRIEPVANLNTQRIAFTSSGVWTGIAPDASVLTLRDLSLQDIYAVELTSD